MQKFLVLSIGILEVLDVVDGFSARPSLATLGRQTQIKSLSSLTRLYGSSFNGNNKGDDGSSSNNNNSEVDRVRKQLESLLGTAEDLEPQVDLEALMDPANANRIPDLIPKPPPLTSAERDRRMAEIELLQALEDSDDTLQDLWDLWFSARGKTAKERLEQADEFMANGNILAAEKMLKQMIREYGVYWVEPLNRLATLLYLDGRLEESFQLCLVVLHLQPHHFGALSGIVAVCIGLGKREEARRWADKRLPTRVASSSFPPFAQDGPTNPRRKEWVVRAVKQAQEAISHLEYQTQKDFGKPEKYYKKRKGNNLGKEDDNSPSRLLDMDEDAWQ